MPPIQIGAVDFAILGVYLVFIVWLGLRVSKKHETAEEYFLAGRKLTWPFIGLSLFASNISTGSLVGMAGAAYGTGLAVYNYEWFAVVILIVFAIFFLPYYLRSKVYTLPEFLERRFDGRARYYHAVVSITGNLLIDTAGSLYAGALAIVLILPGVELWQAVAGLAIITGIYTVMGGLTAVVYTDSIQAVLLLIGSIVITVVAFGQVGSWDAMIAAVSDDHLHLIRPADDSYMPWPGLLLGVPLLGFYYWTTNQYIVQRALGAASVRHGQWGALFAGLLKVPVLFIMVVPGLLGLALYPGLESANQIFPTLMYTLLPTGLLGLVLAGFVAALMSSVDSALNSASTLATMDFYHRVRPHSSSEHLMVVGRVFTILFVVVAALAAPQIDRFPNLFDYLQLVLAYISPPIVAAFLLGMFWRRTTPSGAFAGLVAGGIVGLVLFVAKTFLYAEALEPLHFLYVAFILFSVAAIVMLLVSLITTPPLPEKVEHYSWSRGVFDAESVELRALPWYKNYRIQSIALLAVTLAVVVYFW
ncbi:MAG TPA: sodium:solute symporter [Rhodothermales bacterium]